MGRHVQTMGELWQLNGCRRLNSYGVLLMWIHNSRVAAAATARRNSTGWVAEDKSRQFRLHNGITGQPNMENGFHKQRTLSRVATRVNHQQPNDRHKLLVKTKYAHPWKKKHKICTWYCWLRCQWNGIWTALLLILSIECKEKGWLSITTLEYDHTMYSVDHITYMF